MIKKILLSLTIPLFALAAIQLAQASEVTGNLNPGLDTGISGVTRAAPTLSPGAGTFSSSQSVSLTAASATKICYTTDSSTPACATATTCSTGTALSSGSAVTVSVTTTLKSVACYADASTGPVGTAVYTITSPASGGGGGGGGSTAVYCSSVTYSDWNASCFGSVQSRTVASKSPENCVLTSAQQLATQRTCQISTPETPLASTPEATPAVPAPVPVVTTTTPAPTGGLLADIATEAQILNNKNTDSLLSHLGNRANTNSEQAGLTKYSKILGLDAKINSEEKLTINDFIVYGTRSTQRLGAGQRGSVINSYYQAYRKLPNSEAEWSDVVKIANGRWPVERSLAAENQAKLEFRKVYARRPVMTNNVDENAIMVIAYGLLPLQRNLKSEETASKTFEWVYAHPPVNALAWNVVRAIAYSGAKR